MTTRAALVLAGWMLTGVAQASCGAAFCSASNDWLSLTEGVVAGWRIWGQVEYIDQDRLRTGTDKTNPASVAGHHVETKTLNRNALLGLELGLAPAWSASLVLPYSNREHRHVHTEAGTRLPEAWQIDAIGDARVQLRYQPEGPRDVPSWNLQAGIKVPSGATNVRNRDGDLAERSVQPGSGTTDLLLGGGLAYAPWSRPGSLFSHLALQIPLDEKQGYQPGWRSTFQAGWVFPVIGKTDLVLQGNLLYVARDRGAQAEPDDSGKIEVALVPGLVLAWSRTLSVFGQLELPLYRHVNGVQLTHAYALSLGLALTPD